MKAHGGIAYKWDVPEEESGMGLKREPRLRLFLEWGLMRIS